MSQRDMAARALREILGIKKLAETDEELGKKLNTLCMKTPALLQQSGLAQTMAFLHARTEAQNHGGRYADHLVKTMGHERLASSKALLSQSLEADLASYIALSHKAASAAAWLRRFAQVELAHLKQEGT